VSDGAQGFKEWLDTVPQPGEAAEGQEQLDLVEPPEPVELQTDQTGPLPPEGAIGIDQDAPPSTHSFTPAGDEDAPAEAEREARRGPPEESGHSSVKITVNAKGQRQWEVKVYATVGLSPEDAQSRAIAIEQNLERKYGLPGKSA
jgi:hypothetical protein